jgi:hypothetical protein
VRESESRAFAAGLRFVRVRAFRWRAEVHSTVWQIDGAYNSLVEVVDSDWVSELHEAEPSDHHHWEIHHFMVYVEDSGSYEVASETWEWLPEVEI